MKTLDQYILAAAIAASTDAMKRRDRYSINKDQIALALSSTARRFADEPSMGTLEVARRISALGVWLVALTEREFDSHQFITSKLPGVDK